MSYEARIALRHVPDETQLQVVLGALLGRGRLVAEPDGVRLVLALRRRHGWLAAWTYERIAPLAPMPFRVHDRVLLRSEPHAVFGELALTLGSPRRLVGALRREGMWVWAMYARIGDCERLGEVRCECSAAMPPRLRTLPRAS